LNDVFHIKWIRSCYQKQTTKSNETKYKNQRDVWIGERCQTPPSRKATEDKSFLGDPLGFRAPRFNPSVWNKAQVKSGEVKPHQIFVGVFYANGRINFEMKKTGESRFFSFQ